jgi:hypothetical protein
MKRRLVIVGTCVLSLLVAATAGAGDKSKKDKALAQYLVTVTDDFIVDVYRNGERVPDGRRKLLLERFGATVERISVPVAKGDWLVFNVVNNRMRWGGAYYFAVAGVRSDETTIGFTTELSSGRWSCCDNPSNVNRFISDRDFLAGNTARTVERPWHEGTPIMKRRAPGWSGSPIWGGTRNTWIKFVAR